MQEMGSLILTLSLMSFTTARQSPVFIWGTKSVPKPSLTTMSSDEFVEIVTSLLTDKALVVFPEKDLDTIDLLCTNLVDGKSCYAHLKDVKDTTYYAAVENPLEALLKIEGEHEYNSVDAYGKLSKRLETKAGTINLLNFEEENQATDRNTCLQKHDSIISNITSQFGDNVLFLYTSKTSAPSLRRQRRDSSDVSEGYYFHNGTEFLIYYNSLSIIEQQTVTNLEFTNLTVKPQNKTAKSLALIEKNGSQLTFDIILEGGYFLMKNLMYNNIKYRSSEVYAPTTFSYFCGNLTLTSESGNSNILKWNLLQFQANFGDTKKAKEVFGDAWHCVGFFTGAILSGLLTVALLLTITFIGVCWMMDINTMDRFDDPKGKTITISASD